MSPPPCNDSPNARSSTSVDGMPERLSVSPTAYLASSNAVTSRSVPLRAVPIGVRAAATITASGIDAPKTCGEAPIFRRQYPNPLPALFEWWGSGSGPFFGFGGGVHLNVEVLSAHEDAEQREADVIAQR